jgi:hypothetical protein
MDMGVESDESAQCPDHVTRKAVRAGWLVSPLWRRLEFMRDVP